MKYIKKPWGDDILIDKSLLLYLSISFIVIGLVGISLTILHYQLCNSNNPLLTKINDIFFAILSLMKTGSALYPSPFC